MSTPPVTLPRARFVVDTDGHLDVTIDGRPWHPPTPDRDVPAVGTVPLGSSDIRWAHQQIANELDTPVLVEILKDGQRYSDFVDPDSHRPTVPPAPEDHPAVQAPVVRHAPGEQVTVAAVVARTHADQDGIVHFQLPPAVLNHHALLVHGETSGTTIPFDQLPQPDPTAGPAPTTPAPNAPTPGTSTPGPSHPVTPHRSRGARPGTAPRPAAPAGSERPAAQGPDVGLGAL